MYDQLTGRYTFSCPARDEVRLPLSRFRALERLPGPARPAVFKITFACECGDEHEGLATHEDLDWAPLAGSDASFLNLMTARLESAAAELLELAATRIRAGDWPGASSAIRRSARGRSSLPRSASSPEARPRSGSPSSAPPVPRPL
jgi:hypothetical protein